MSSDESYLSFLNNANADVSQPQASTSATAAPTTQSIHLTETIPASLSTIHETIYTSETDEPFDPVVLKWADASGGIWPDKTQFATMVSPVADAGLEGGITVCGVGEWDPRGMYGGVVRAVREAAGFGEKGEAGEGDDGEVRVYRVEVGVSRVEYFVVALERNGGRVVGVRARSVES